MGLNPGGLNPGGSPAPRLELVECPHCEEPTMPNLLADGSVVCSCTAERALPIPPRAPITSATQKES